MGGGGEAQTEPFGSKRKTQRDEGWKIVFGRGEKEMFVGRWDLQRQDLEISTTSHRWLVDFLSKGVY